MYILHYKSNAQRKKDVNIKRYTVVMQNNDPKKSPFPSPEIKLAKIFFFFFLKTICAMKKSISDVSDEFKMTMINFGQTDLCLILSCYSFV